jgi:type II secretory pathway component HofQ
MKTPTALSVIALTLAALAAPNLSRELAAAEKPLDERINIALTKAPPVQVFASFGQLLGMQTVLDPAVKASWSSPPGRQLSIVLENVRVKTALDAACESLDCRWEVQEGTPLKLVIRALPKGERKPAPQTDRSQPIDLKVTNADARDLLKTFGQLIEAEVVLDPAPTGTLSFELTNTPWDKALDTVCKQAGCDWTLTGGENGEKKILKVTAKGGRKGA